MDINSICKNEYFQNDVIDLRIHGDIGSGCIYRFPLFLKTSIVHLVSKDPGHQVSEPGHRDKVVQAGTVPVKPG